jgi:hypothetical protein
MQAIAFALFAVFYAVAPVPGGDGARSGQAGLVRMEDALRREGDALAEIADATLAGRGAPADFTLAWRNDFLKAQPGTFIPFTLTFDARGLSSRAALLYVRAERHGNVSAGSARATRAPAYETIFPVRLAGGAHPAHLTRGFAVPPGRYRVVVVLRDAPEEDGVPLRDRRTGTLVRDLDVPDFWTAELAISTVILANRVEPLSEPVPATELDEDPYVVGTNRIHPAAGAEFPRDRELVVVFLVYNPSVGADKHFDVQVDYHVYRTDPGGPPSPGEASAGRAARPGERYVTRTNPQRFNPPMMGPRFDPGAGTPVLAGQGILLSGFEPGDYRLEITVTDLLSRKSLSRDVVFAVVGS